MCWSGVACGGMPARDRADAAAVRDAWADGGPAAGVLAGVRRAVPGWWKTTTPPVHPTRGGGFREMLQPAMRKVMCLNMLHFVR